MIVPMPSPAAAGKTKAAAAAISAITAAIVLEVVTATKIIPAHDLGYGQNPRTDGSDRRQTMRSKRIATA